MAEARGFQSFGKLTLEFLDWNVFSKTFGFYQICQEREWTEHQVEQFRKGFVL